VRGIIPPLVTPFRADGALDLAAFEANLETYAGWDLGGYLVLGSNGEAATLEEDDVTGHQGRGRDRENASVAAPWARSAGMTIAPFSAGRSHSPPRPWNRSSRRTGRGSLRPASWCS